ncbi:hypothetical protein MC885_016642 [Smutsia gigantea]|nr:hypothetical protein MC885_016642 [Smutsia gigantea]
MDVLVPRTIVYTCSPIEKERTASPRGPPGSELWFPPGDFPFPVLAAAPVLWFHGRSVTVVCWGTPESFLYHLETLENSTYKVVEKKWGFQTKAEFIINRMDADTAGCYRCRYKKQYSWSERSDTLELVVTGRLFAQRCPYSWRQSACMVSPSSLLIKAARVARLGERVSLQCGSAHVPFDRYSLAKDGEAALSQHQNGGHRGNFIVGPVNASFSGNYSCYGWYSGSPYVWSAPSDALELVVTETLWKPVIWAQPNFMIPKGRSVTIWCQGAHSAAEYQLYFEGRLFALKRQKPPRVTSKVKFSLSAVTSLTAGQYSCLYPSGELWSEPSDPLDLVVTEMYDTPTLSVHPGPQVVSGENASFSCRLDTATSTFFLLKEGRPSRPQRRHGSVQAEFPLGPVSTAHRGTYRCFGSYNNHVWSFPSEPVRLLVTELALWNHTAQNLLRIGLAFLVLMALGGLLAEDWLCRKRTREEAHRAPSREGRTRLQTRRVLDE